MNKQQVQLIESLVEEGYNIVSIHNPIDKEISSIFVFQEFREATQQTNYHSMSAFKEITHIIDDNSSYTNVPGQLRTIVTTIENTKAIMTTRKWSSDFSWIWW